MEKNNTTRRSFLKNSAIATGAATISPFVIGNVQSGAEEKDAKLP